MNVHCTVSTFNTLIRWCSDVQLFELATSYGIRMSHHHHRHNMNSENFPTSNWVLTVKFNLIYCLTGERVRVRACVCNATFESRRHTHTHSVDTLNESFELLMTGTHRGLVCCMSRCANSHRSAPTHKYGMGMEVVTNGKAKI